MIIERFATRNEAKEMGKKMIGWNTKIVKTDSGYVIQCNGSKYLRENGSVN